MRGKAPKNKGRKSALRITPAHAGKRVKIPFLKNFVRDHPRTCGEKPLQGEDFFILVGSPPHMRGKALKVRKPVVTAGITPAHAGKRCGSDMQLGRQRDHPRTCGEKTDASSVQVKALGSPPHMRGKEKTLFIVTFNIGITPAHAGKSYVNGSKVDIDEDHPRTCGEKKNFIKG